MDSAAVNLDSTRDNGVMRVLPHKVHMQRGYTVIGIRGAGLRYPIWPLSLPESAASCTSIRHGFFEAMASVSADDNSAGVVT